MEVIGVVADTVPPSGKGVRYRAFGGVGVTAMVVEVLLRVGRFDVDRGAEVAIFNMDFPSHVTFLDIDVHLDRPWGGPAVEMRLWRS